MGLYPPNLSLASCNTLDVVKHQVKKEKYELDEKLLERTFKEYLDDKNWNRLVNYFTPYTYGILEQLKKFREPPYKFGNGRLVKSVEDMMLAGLLKNYVQYDYVVGNPPYVRIQMLDPKQVAYYKKNYECGHQNFDLYVVFIERGVNWLRDDGKFGYICSNQFMKRGYGLKLREYILKNCAIKHIVDFGDSGVFKDATNYPCILIMSKKPSTESFTCINVFAPQKGILKEITGHINAKEYQTENFNILKINQTELTKKPWEFFPKDEIKLLEKIKIKAKNLLGKKCGLLLGIQTGRDKILIGNIENEVSDHLALFTPSGLKKNKYKIEKDLLKPILRGRNVRAWDINFDSNFVVFPQKEKNMKLTVINEENMKKSYPYTYDFLTAYKPELETRLMYKKTPMELHGEWYATMYIQKSGGYEDVKILTPALTDKNNFAIDESNYYFVLGTAGVYGILPNDVDAYFLLGILNSKVSEYYLKHITPIKAGGYYQYSTKFLERFPLKLPQTKKERTIADKIKSKVNQIISQVKIKHRIEKFPDPFLEEYKGIELIEIKHSFNANHKSLEPFTTTSGETYSIILAKKENLICVETKTQADYLITALKGKRVKKGEKITILIPRDENVLNKILKEYKEELKNIEKLLISKLEDEINKLVYEFYDLNENDKIIIKEFLSKF